MGNEVAERASRSVAGSNVDHSIGGNQPINRS